MTGQAGPLRWSTWLVERTRRARATQKPDGYPGRRAAEVGKRSGSELRRAYRKQTGGQEKSKIEYREQVQDGDTGLGQTKLDGRCRIGCHRLERPVARDSLTLQERWQRGVGARRALGLLWQWSWMLGWQDPPPVLTGEKNIYMCGETTKYITAQHCAFPAKIAKQLTGDPCGSRARCAPLGQVPDGMGEKILARPGTIIATKALVKKKQLLCTLHYRKRIVVPKNYAKCFNTA